MREFQGTHMHNRKRFVIAAIVAALTLSNMAMAAEPLAPGKPASVKNAQMITSDTWLGLGLAAIVVGVTIGVTSGGGNAGTTSVSTSTSTSTTS